MTEPANTSAVVYSFADLTLNAAEHRVFREGRQIEVSALNFDLLRFLVESAPNVVTLDALAEKVWGRHFVSPENVAQRVMLLRQSLSDDANRPRYIETVRNKGYRLIPSVRSAPLESSSGARERPSSLRRAAAALAVGLVSMGIGVYWLSSARQAPTPEARVPPRNSIAVLPFENLSPDPDNYYFAAAMHEAIQAQLDKVGSLELASRTSVRRYAGTLKSAGDIARELNVATILDGSVRYAGAQVIVAVHLSDGATDKSLWAESYQRELRDIFAMESDIALKVAEALKAELSPGERARVVRPPNVSPTAYQLFLSATARITTASTGGPTLDAIAEIDEVVRLAPQFAEAWALKANARTLGVVFDPEHGEEHLAAAEAAARTAIGLDSELGRAHAGLGFALTMKKDWTGAEAAYREAIRRKVPLADLSGYALLQRAVGNFTYARQILEVTRDAAPATEVALFFLLLDNALLGDWPQVEVLYEAGKRLFEPFPQGDYYMMHLLLSRGDRGRARTIPVTDSLDASMLAKLEGPDAALDELRELYASTGPREALRLRNIGIWAGYFGDPDLALRAMRAAVAAQGGQTGLVWLPQLKSMRALPEFKTMLRDIGLVAYWKRYGWPEICKQMPRDDFECD